jgi:hypothetical protein
MINRMLPATWNDPIPMIVIGYIDEIAGIVYAMCYTDDGLLSYYGYDPASMTFEKACLELLREIESRGLKIVTREEYLKIRFAAKRVEAQDGG